MFKFTIEYYFKQYHTGSLNTEEWRTATVIADTLDQALNKVRVIDPNYIRERKVSFEELILPREAAEKALGGAEDEL